MAFRAGFGIAAVVVLLGTLSAFQLPFREFPGVEYQLGSIPLPSDWNEKTEWTFARLMYPPSPNTRGGFGRGFGFRNRGVWQEGNTIWTQDYPRADRHFVLALRRLTRIDVRTPDLEELEVSRFSWRGHSCLPASALLLMRASASSPTRVQRVDRSK